MITEVADFRVPAEKQAEFEAALAKGVSTVIAKAAGFRSHRVQRCIETPGRYLLLIEWETLEDHTVGFRGSPAFPAWRAIVGPYFSTPPAVEHFEAVTP